MAKIMIGGTFLDMIEHRRKAIEAIVRLGHVPIAMDYPKSVDRNALNNSLKMVEDCQAYVLIMSRRYGTIPNEETVSLSELEYIRASALGKPRLVFAMSDDHLVKAIEIDTGKPADELKRFLASTKQDRVRSNYNSADHLGMLLIDALRSLPLDNSEQQEHASVTVGPPPPRPWIVHPYTLLDSELVGRDGYIETLDAWRRDPQRSTFVVHAIGGMGKSALSWQWFCKEIVKPDFTSRWAGAFWWSFYETDATFNNFLLNLLSYVSGKPVEKLETKKRPLIEADLRSALADKPYLVVMDGFERELNAYGSMLANQSEATQAASPSKREVTDENVPVNLSTVNRQTINLRDGDFLASLAEISISKLLISSRLVPACMESSPGKARPHVVIEELFGLKEDEAVKYWTSLGVTGSTSAVKQLVNSIEGYPLLIKALAGAVRDFKASPGNLDQWQFAHPRFDPYSLPLKQRQTHVLQYALANLSKQEWRVLSAIAAMRGPASYDFIRSWLVGPERVCKTENVLIGYLSDLETRGLVGWDRLTNRYDMHPIVRNVVWAKVTIKDRSRIQSEMAEQLKGVASTVLASSREELLVPIEIVRSLNDSGKFDEAWELFDSRLANFLHRSSDRTTVRDLLSPMFGSISEGKKISSPLKSSAARERASLLLGYAEADADDFANALALMRYHAQTCNSYFCRLHQLSVLESCTLHNSCERLIQDIMKEIIRKKDFKTDYSAHRALFYCLAYLIGYLVRRNAAREARGALRTLKAIEGDLSGMNNQKFAFALTSEAEVLKMEGCHSEALALYANIAEKMENTEHTSALYAAVKGQFNIYIKLGNLDAAADHLKRLLRLAHEVQSNARWRSANLAHAQLLVASGRFDEAEDRLNSTEASIPADSFGDRARCLFHKGRLNEKEGRVDLARDTAKKLLALYQSSGDTPRGLNDLEWAVRICDGSVPLLFPQPISWPTSLIEGDWKTHISL